MKAKWIPEFSYRDPENTTIKMIVEKASTGHNAAGEPMYTWYEHQAGSSTRCELTDAAVEARKQYKTYQPERR